MSRIPIRGSEVRFNEETNTILPLTTDAKGTLELFYKKLGEKLFPAGTILDRKTGSLIFPPPHLVIDIVKRLTDEHYVDNG